MKETIRAIRDLKWLLIGLGALVVGTLAAHAQKTDSSQTSSTTIPAVKLRAMAAQSQTPAAAPQTQPPAQAQAPAPSPTPTPINWSDDPMLKRFVLRGIGPASMGGRIDDIACVDSNSYICYVGFATGGV